MEVKVFVVYDADDKPPTIGSLEQIANFLDIKLGTIRSYISKNKNGKGYICKNKIINSGFKVYEFDESKDDEEQLVRVL